jgi:Dolichyl-phosphate-mannose-protein mannosyltransferase
MSTKLITKPSPKPHFSLLATTFPGGPRPRNAALILSGLWLVLFFVALFAPPVLDDADATHANAARAMAATGQIITLRVDGVRYLEKAPLPYWLTAICYKIFGVNAFATHLPQAIAVLLLMLLGHRWANQAFGARTGFYTALAILTSTGVFLFTRILIPEVLLSLLLATALFAFLKTLTPKLAETAPEESIVEGHAAEVREQPAFIPYAGPLFYPYVMWVALALAVLSKGLVALVFFFATTGAYLLLTDELRQWRRLRPFSGGLLFLAIGAPWHVLAAMQTPGPHGFVWFYFWNEHVLRFLGRRVPADFNKLPGWLYWVSHAVWLFPWALFLPLGIAAIWRRFRHQTFTLTRNSNLLPPLSIQLALMAAAILTLVVSHGEVSSAVILVIALYAIIIVVSHRLATGFAPSPFHRIDAQQRSILLLALFAAIVLLFFSLSTNQEYYTFPAYLPILLLIAATITRAEQTYSSNPSARRWIAFAHYSFMLVGAVVAFTLLIGLWQSRRLPFIPDIGSVLAHRGVGSYTLSMSHLFDLTTQSFAALRFPALLAAWAFLVGPTVAWTLRMQRRHIAATTCIGFTSAVFLIAAHVAFARFGPMLSSRAMAAKIQRLEQARQVDPNTQIMLFGDQSFGSSIPFYLGRQVQLVDARSSSMLFGSEFADAAPIFVSSAQLANEWGKDVRKIVFVPAEKRDEFDRLLGKREIVIEEMSGKALVTDRPLDGSLR